MTRNVKSPGAALARTTRPVAEPVLAIDTAHPRRVGDGLENVVAGLGTDRDKSYYSVYMPPRVLSRQELDNMYRCSWLAKRIVNSVAEDMTREWRTVMFDSKDEKHQKAIEQAEKKLGVKAKVTQALKWGRLYGGSLVIIGTKDSKDMSKPLDKERVKKGDLQWLQVVDRWRISPSSNCTTELSSPNFGLPEYYVLAESSVMVHHTRVLRFDGQMLPYFPWLQNGMWHDSELQHVLDSITTCDQTTRGIATMIFEANVDVIKVNELGQLLGSKDGEAKLIKRFQTAATMKSFNRTLILSGDEDYEKKTNSFANLDKILINFMVDVCGAADIPMTRLFGQSAAGLNSTGDGELTNYYDMLKAKQEAELRTAMDYLDEILVRSELGAMPDDFSSTFNSLWQQSEAEVATTQKTKAERDRAYFDMGVITEGIIARELKEDGTYKTLTDEDVDAAEELSKMLDEQGNTGMLPGQVPQLPGQVPQLPGEEVIVPGEEGKVPNPAEPGKAKEVIDPAAKKGE